MTPLSGVLRCCARKASPVIDQRVTALVSMPTGLQPSAVRMWR